MASEDCYDELLFHILKESKTLPVFLDTIFGFLKRRTDFYIVTDTPGPIGFRPKVAEHMMYAAYTKWSRAYCQDPVTCNTPASNPQMPRRQSPQDDLVDTSKILEMPLELPIPAVEKSLTKSYTANPECYNGRTTDQYSWSQCITEIDFIYNLPPNVHRKNLDISIGCQFITITHTPSGSPIFHGNLPHKIKHTDALWSVDLQKHQLCIHLDKQQELWWDHLFEGEDRLDISKIDCSRPFEELSDEAQSKIEELQWIQDRKRLGLESTATRQVRETLKKSWNADGSPFEGPYDPNIVALE